MTIKLHRRLREYAETIVKRDMYTLIGVDPVLKDKFIRRYAYRKPNRPLKDATIEEIVKEMSDEALTHALEEIDKIFIDLSEEPQ